MTRKISFFFAISFCFFLFSFLFSSSSCTKTNTVTKIVTDTVIKTQIDTFQLTDTTLTATILTANPWKVFTDRAAVGGNTFYYMRGGLDNTQSLDNEYMTFSSDGTGIYSDNSGASTTFTWSFTDATNTKLSWLWNLPTPVTVNWENIYYKDDGIHYTEYYTQFGVNTLGSIVRIPK